MTKPKGPPPIIQKPRFRVAGRPIKTWKALCEEIDANTERGQRCWVWKGSLNTRDGYGRICYAKSSWLVHRLQFFRYTGKYPDVVMHTCDNPYCVRPNHLRGGTIADNNRDCASKGRRSPKGRMGLNPQIVEWARKEVAKGETITSVHRRLKAHYGRDHVNLSAFCRAIRGVNWGPVSGEENGGQTTKKSGGGPERLNLGH